MSDPSTPFEALAVGAVLATALLLVAVYFLRRLRLSRSRAGAERPARPEVASDRAYNRLAMARREASLLDAQGVDVGRARDLIALADRSFQAREFDRAFELAQSAHESLVQLRRRGTGAPGPAPTRASPPVAPTTSVHRAAPSPASPSAAPTTEGSVTSAMKIPRNKLEAQFQIHLFEKEQASKSAGPELDAARPTYEQARAAFEREEYTEALRLGLKARRQLGGAVETLAPTPLAARAGAAPLAEPVRTAESAAASDRCPQCGYPVVAGDAYCRGCGAPRTALACPKCGAARRPADGFCGKCGTRYA